MSLALLFPGQGAQKVGLGKDFYHEARYRQTFEEASDLLGYDLYDVCQTEKINETQYTQVALFTASLATLKLLSLPEVAVGCGLSLGEYTAVAASQALSFAEFLPVVQMRGQLMQAQAEKVPGTMVAVLGADLATIAAACEKVQAETKGIVQPCNFNTTSQVVIGGEKAAVELAVAELKAQGIKKLIPLTVSGAFHSPLFQTVADTMAEKLQTLSFNAGRFPILSNASGQVTTPSTMAQQLAKQIAAPVQMVTMCQTLADLGVTHTLEVGCGQVVSGLVKKNQKAIQTLAVDDPKSLTLAQEKLEEYYA
ncbi:ACP S-malonyltransferase [Enterococcus nangangensis]|uniref:ACP S-malonyltransferase n=1 Tax=Enterococcus nangangensis TaxID=2559926 RepID=UPI0010FA5B16|nr:ACP S-malonyltransferase [Enterococcus nangangensis]